MGFHPLSDKTARREQLLDSVDQIVKNHGALAGLNVQALLLEIFEATDAMQRVVQNTEAILKALQKLAQPLALTTQPDLPLNPSKTT